MKFGNPSSARGKGRPRSFDRERALHQAMLLFWRHGYEATSLQDLTSAMGVTPPTIYGSFGNKKALFLECLDRYLSGPVNSDSIIDCASTAGEAVRGLLEAAAVGFTGEDTPRGCLLANSATCCSAAAEDVRVELAQRRRNIEARLRGRIVRAVQDNEIREDADAEALAAHVMAVIQGMSVLARDGASRETLMRVVEQVMKGWPGTNEGGRVIPFSGR